MSIESDKTWFTEEKNGKPFQYSWLENLMYKKYKKAKKKKKKELQYSSCSWWHAEKNNFFFSKTVILKDQRAQKRPWEGPSFKDSGIAEVGSASEIQNSPKIYSRRHSEHNISHISKLKAFKDQVPWLMPSVWSLQGPRICRMTHLRSQPLWLQRFHQ